MKKILANIRTLAALLIAGAAFTACSSDDNSIDQPINPTEPKVYTLTINATKGAASTRALTLDGEKLVTKWETTDVVSVFKASSRSECTAENLKGTVSPVAGTISADGQSATFKGTISGVSATESLMLVYHPAAFSPTAFEGQAGTLASASALDCATAKVTVASVSGSDITISEPKATFTTHTAMLKLKLTTDGTTTINPTQLKMTMSAGGTPLKEYTFSPTAATYTANGGGGILYFALPSAADVAAGLGSPITETTLSGATISYTATVGSDTYTATKTGYTFAASKYYAGTLTMTKLITYPIALSEVTIDYLGSVVTTDGNVYATVSDATTAGKTPAAMIAYVGNETGHATYTHGLALSLANECHYEYWSNAESACKNKTPAIANAEWMFPSEAVWRRMMLANGGNNNNYMGLNEKLAAAGGRALCTEDTEHRYWAEKAGMNSAKKLFLKNDGSVVVGYSNPNNDTYGDGRAVLAF